MPTRRLPRFSLLNALLLMTIVALGVSLVVSARRNAQLDGLIRTVEAENLKYRNELGVIDVQQPGRIHAIQLPPQGDEPVKFRVYLPPGRTYSLKMRANDIPAGGVPEDRRSDILQPGEYVISVDIQSKSFSQDAGLSPEAQASVTVENRGNVRPRRSVVVHRLTEKENDWIKNQQSGLMNFIVDAIDRELTVQNLDQPLVLFRLRAAKYAFYRRRPNGVTSRQQRIAEDCDGFMLWIEQMDDESGF